MLKEQVKQKHKTKYKILVLMCGKKGTKTKAKISNTERECGINSKNVTVLISAPHTTHQTYSQRT
jgi:hypothetical protein